MRTAANIRAIVRMITGIIFLLLGAAKLAAPDIFIARFPQTVPLTGSFGWYRPFLAHVVLRHTSGFAWSIAVLELLIGLALILGIATRVAAVAGCCEMVNLALARGNPGPGPFTRYLIVNLVYLAFALLFLSIAAETEPAWSLGNWMHQGYDTHRRRAGFRD